MTDRLTPDQEKLCREIGSREKRMLRSRSERRAPFMGLRVFGMVGWSVAVPTLLGLGAGIFLDSRGIGAGRMSWTLTLLVVGVVSGCANAWYWVSREGGLDSGGPARPGREKPPPGCATKDEEEHTRG
jgi:ATP synthase protein I